jgi:superoxide reductase
MKGFVCGVCGYISINGSAPENCPVCKAPKTAFQEKDVIKTAENEGPKEKHVPVIKVVKQCGLVGEGCTDVHAKIGETLHPSEPDHYIMWIDIYVDKKWIFRAHLTPECNPIASAHIKAKEGKLTAIELCNIHGYWINEADL